MDNQGYDQKEIAAFRQECAQAGTIFLENEEEMQRPEFRHFLFVGKYEGKEVIYDAVIYTLEMAYASTLYEIADQKAAEEFPDYKPWELEADEDGNLVPDAEVNEEIEEYKASIIMELEADDEYKVHEQIQYDETFEFGVGLEVALNVPEVTDEVIVDFITKFNDGTFRLDPTLYRFELPDEDFDGEEE